MLDTTNDPEDLQGGLTDTEKRDNVVRFAFGGDAARFEAFCAAIGSAIPPGTAAVLRGSALTGRRWRDGAAFDAEGPGTSDLDLTLVGADAVALFEISGFFIPGIHSRPLSDEDPDIAPDLLPLRARLMTLARRPVNIQATRDIVMAVRGELLDQPYLILIGRSDDAS